MPSKISYFSVTIFKKNFSRFWPLWLVYFIVWFCVMPLVLIGNLRDYGMWNSEYYNRLITGGILDTAWSGGMVIAGVFSAFAAMAVFGHLYSAKSAGMMASLPIRREGLFLTSWLSAVIPMLSVNVLIFFISLGVEAAYGTVSVGHLLQWLAIVSMNTVTFFGFSSLCAMLTGSMLVLPIVYTVLNFTAFIVEQLTRVAMNSFVFGMDISGNTFAFLSPPVFMLMRRNGVETIWNSDETEVLRYVYTGWNALAIYCLAGLTLSALALWLYKKRRMETAADVVALNPLKPVFKYCMAFGGSLVIGAGIYISVFDSSFKGATDAVAMTAFMLAGGFIGYFAAEMLIKKALRVFRGSWKGFVCFAAVLAALAAFCEFDVTGYEKRVPNPADVEQVSIYCQGAALLTEPENIEAAVELHKSIIGNKSLHEQKPDFLENPVSYYYTTISYTLSGGGTMSRAYMLLYDTSSDVNELENLLNTREAMLFRNKPAEEVAPSNIFNASIDLYDPKEGMYHGISVTPEQMYELYTECMLPDIADGTLGRIWLHQDESMLDIQYALTISFNLYETGLDDRKIIDKGYLYVHPTIYSERTNAWLLELGVELVTQRESEVFYD